MPASVGCRPSCVPFYSDRQAVTGRPTTGGQVTARRKQTTNQTTKQRNETLERETPAVRLRGFQTANCSANCSAKCQIALPNGSALAYSPTRWLAGWLAAGTAQRRCGDATLFLLLVANLIHRPTVPLHSTHTIPIPLTPINPHHRHPPPLRAPQSAPKKRRAAAHV